ncbi:MAG: hypothetical protein OJF50_002787 [Nitrospira sp.]|jgi:nitrogen fixation protein|nr:hypothetical protein [Nitrospira sp.]
MPQLDLEEPAFAGAGEKSFGGTIVLYLAFRHAPPWEPRATDSM